RSAALVSGRRPSESDAKMKNYAATLGWGKKDVFLYLQLALQFVQKAPIGVFGDELLWVGLDQTGLVQPQCIEAERVLGIQVAPTVVTDFAQRLQRIVVTRRDSSVDHQLCGTPRIGCTQVSGLQYGAQRALGGNGIFASKLRAGRQHAAIILRPWSVCDAAGDHMSDFPGANFL